MPVVTLILDLNGALRLASDKISTTDAERWAAEGKPVFRLAYAGGRWAVNHVNAGRLIGDGLDIPGDPPLTPLLTLKEKT